MSSIISQAMETVSERLAVVAMFDLKVRVTFDDIEYIFRALFCMVQCKVFAACGSKTCAVLLCLLLFELRFHSSILFRVGMPASIS
jgi:hypothetical protein